eukprot:TRINITY_DN114088_c0_g1_i1.p1 TRINITY_DN114088_c0_g1~~TRINITY_DN114088_c0_g1_i1.p1  ORF type:complete len:367 (-),score=176.59 TRINITY_DN114088_c0_g1_i1:1146-2168(-)
MKKRKARVTMRVPVPHDHNQPHGGTGEVFVQRYAHRPRLDNGRGVHGAAPSMTASSEGGFNQASMNLNLDMNMSIQLEPQPPLVLIHGMAQSSVAWTMHVAALAQHRPVICYDLRAHGATTLDATDVSFEQHMKDFEVLYNHLDLAGQRVDLCGFSLGGRVALSIAAHYPEMVRRVAMTGVSADRDAMGRLILHSWQNTLRTGDMEAFAYTALTHSHTPQSIAAIENRVPAMLKALKANGLHAMRNIMEQTYLMARDDPFHALNLAEHVQSPVLLVAGEQDRLAPPLLVSAMADIINANQHPDALAQLVMMPGAGHMMHLEAAHIWLSTINDFLLTPGYN